VDDEKNPEDRDRYRFLRDHGRCVACKVADPAPGRVRCQACLEEASRRSKKSRYASPGRLERYRAVQRATRERWKRMGLCARCGSGPTTTATLCEGCRKNIRKTSSACYVPSATPRLHKCGLCREEGHNARTCPMRPLIGLPGIDEFGSARRAP
jgi:hypothetical protein